MVTRGRAPTQASAGRRGRRPLRLAREWAAAEASPSSGPAGPPSPEGEGKGCNPSRGVGGGGRSRRGGGTPPYGWGYGNAVGFTRAAVPGAPRGRGRACPARGFAWAGVNGSVRREGSWPLRGWLPGGWVLAGGSAGRRGRRPLRFAREWAAAQGRGGVGAPRPTDGDMETLRGLRGHPFPGRRTVGAGHARPGGWRGQALPFYHLTPPTSPPAYSRCCRQQNRWGRSAHRPDVRFRRWIRSRRASGHRRSGPEGTGVCCRRNFSSAG